MDVFSLRHVGLVVTIWDSRLWGPSLSEDSDAINKPANLLEQGAHLQVPRSIRSVIIMGLMLDQWDQLQLGFRGLA